MIDVGQDAVGRWAFMIATPAGRLIASDWDFETEVAAYQAALDALNVILAAARELEERPEAARMLAARKKLP